MKPGIKKEHEGSAANGAGEKGAVKLKKRSYLTIDDEFHTKEMKDVAEQRKEKYAMQMKQLRIQELKLQAQQRKSELELAKAQAQAQQNQAMIEMMRMAFMAQGSGSRPPAYSGSLMNQSSGQEYSWNGNNSGSSNWNFNLNFLMDTLPTPMGRGSSSPGLNNVFIYSSTTSSVSYD
jgi:hypothetical protein